MNETFQKLFFSFLISGRMYASIISLERCPPQQFKPPPPSFCARIPTRICKIYADDKFLGWVWKAQTIKHTTQKEKNINPSDTYNGTNEIRKHRYKWKMCCVLQIGNRRKVAKDSACLSFGSIRPAVEQFDLFYSFTFKIKNLIRANR